MGKRLPSLALLSLAVLGCQPPGGGGGNAAPLLINGAGSTFGYPIYSKWFDVYTEVDPGVRVNYQSIGSGGGLNLLFQQSDPQKGADIVKFVGWALTQGQQYASPLDRCRRRWWSPGSRWPGNRVGRLRNGHGG